LLHACVSMVMSAQQSDYNVGNSWVHPSTLKQTGFDFINTSTGVLVNNGTVWYTGNFRNDGSVDYTTQLALQPGLSRFDGTSDKTLSGGGTTRFYRVWFSAPAFKLQQNIEVDNEADFDNGIIYSVQTTPQTEMNSVQMGLSASWINASDVCHVDGFVSKKGNTEFTFPIGNDGYCRPASISAQTDSSAVFSARYIHKSPASDGFDITKKGTGVGRVNNKEYWIVNRSSGTTFPSLTLTWDADKTSDLMTTDLLRVQIVRWDGSQWINEGNVATTGNSTKGNVTAKITGFGIFTLSTVISHLVAIADTVTMIQGNTYEGTVAANDTINGGTVVWAVTANPLHGTITMQSNGRFEYRPDSRYFGSDSLTYTLSDEYGDVVSAKVRITITQLSGYVLVNKHSTVPVLQADGTFVWNYNIILSNLQSVEMHKVLVEDDLSKVFVSPITFTVTGILATGNLKSNGLYDGLNHTDLLIDESTLAPNSKDSVTITLKVSPHDYVGEVYNQAAFEGISSLVGSVSNILTDDDTNTQSADTPRPTVTTIPKVDIVVPDAFSPNKDGINDTFFIPHSDEVTLKIEVFNRWGVRVYKNNSYMNDWDGKGTGSLLGSDLLNGTYYYIIETTHQKTGAVNKYSGFVTLRR
jgi:gliding motility-associated-like protein